MNKKSQTKQTNPRRTKGRVYQMDKYVPMPEVAAPMSENQVAQLTKIESICDKARRLANEAEKAKKSERAERELAFMKKMFETDDLASAGVVIDKVREDGTIEYLICGRRWTYGENFTCYDLYGKPIHFCYITNQNKYLGHSLCHEGWHIWDLESFGRLLKHIDQCEVKLRAKYPDNLWGRFKAYWSKQSS